jgi:hypothetical protein
MLLVLLVKRSSKKPNCFLREKPRSPSKQPQTPRYIVKSPPDLEGAAPYLPTKSPEMGVQGLREEVRFPTYQLRQGNCLITSNPTNKFIEGGFPSAIRLASSRHVFISGIDVVLPRRRFAGGALPAADFPRPRVRCSSSL